MKKALLLLLSLTLTISIAEAKKAKSEKTPDNEPQEETCVGYGCEDLGDSRGGGRDDVDGTGSGYDGGSDSRGDGDGGGMIGELFALRIKSPLMAQIELTCTDGDFVKEIITQSAKKVELTIGGNKLFISPFMNALTGENFVTVEAISDLGSPLFALFKSWPHQKDFLHTFDVQVDGEKNFCQIRVTPK